jgi:transposase
VWFQDEARVGQQGTLARLWARKGSRPTAPKDCRYAWAYIFGAVCPARATGAALVMPCANTEAMNAHLAEISRNVAHGAHAILVLDGAGWHGSKDLKVPENITLMTLPPYSPELNPVENIWQFLRQNRLANRVFETYDAIVDACCVAWNALIESPNTIASISSRDWATVNA